MYQCDLRVLVIAVLTALIAQASFAQDTEDISSPYNCSVQEESQLRVRGTPLKNVGHLEICHERIWGVICADHWSFEEAQVACRQLTGANTSQDASVDPAVLKMWNRTGFYTQDQRPRKEWLGHVYCNGQEKRFIDCGYDRPLQRRPLNVGYLYADQSKCFSRLEVGGVNCTGTSIVTTPSTPPTVPSTTTSIIATLTTTETISKINSGYRTATVPTSRIPGEYGTGGPITVIVNSPSTRSTNNLTESQTNQGIAVSTSPLVVNVKKSSSNTFLVPFVIMAVACILLMVDVIRKFRQAINLRNGYKQLGIQVALVEARNNELILYKEREKPAGGINVDVMTSEPTSVKLSTLINTDDADGVYSKPAVVPSQGQTQTADTMSAGADSTYSKVGIVTATAPDSCTSTNKRSGDVYSLPTPRCNRVSPELKKSNTNRSANSSDEDHDEGGEQPVIPPKVYEENEA